jgi:endonuclease-8
MPEGDTIHKFATALQPELQGRVFGRARLKRLDGSCLEGRTINGVSSRGKHLFIELDNGLVLRSHLGMYGAWHRYRPAEPWRKPAWQASMVLQVEEQLFVCFNAKEVEILRAGGYRLADARQRLGPDLIRDHPDAAVLERRARELLEPELSVVDLLIDQRLAVGIGNVYKSDVLFLARRSPFDQLEGLSESPLWGLYRRAQELLLQNLGGGHRITRPPGDGRGNLWVYGRGGTRCLRCAAMIERAQLGRIPRVTYWCPRCQAREGALEVPG